MLLKNRCYCPAEEDWLEMLCKAEFLALSKLTLSGYLQTQCLSNLSGLSNLTFLSIGSHVQDNEIQYISTLTKLNSLDLKGSSIQNKALESLVTLTNLKALSSITTAF